MLQELDTNNIRHMENEEYFPPLEKFFVSQLMISEKRSFLLFMVEFNYGKLNAFLQHRRFLRV